MGETEITREQSDEVLFRFLQSIYLYEKRELMLFGITWDEVYLMQLLIRNKPMTVSELANRLGVKVFSASRMITRLNSNGLVAKEQSLLDRRATNVTITPTGMDRIREIEAYNHGVICSNIDSLGKARVMELMDSIGKLDLLLNLHDLNGENENGTEE